MPKPTDTEEVRVLRFFEEEPMEIAELLFNIVAAKMQERRASKAPANASAPAEARKPRKKALNNGDMSAHGGESGGSSET